MDKSWIDLPNRVSTEYFNGIEQFLTFAYKHKNEGSLIKCPCKKCQNRYFLSQSVVREHLKDNGFLKKYKNWTDHGKVYVPLHRAGEGTSESEGPHIPDTRDDMVGMINEAIGIPDVFTSLNDDEACANDPRVNLDENTTQYFKLLEDAQSELYPGCKKFTVLSFIVRLLHVKVLNGLSDKAFTMILELVNEAFPDGVKLPKLFYHARKITRDLGFTYETWDACPNHCMLFKNDEVGSLDKCLICGTSRYKVVGTSNNVAVGGVKCIVAQQVRYFPLKPRLQRLFMSSKTAKHMRWHAEERTDDHVFRHPADSFAWKNFDQRHTAFSGDTRNVKLGLASDGFNPFRTMSISYSTWPVVLIPYNLPPWMCMKQPFLILSMLIDGPNGPLDKIDVYMQPLIDELKELWEEGIATFDASCNQMFQLHAALLWTINDFPAYANLSGWSMKGQFACPICNIDPSSRWLKNCGKFAYLGSRRYLPRNHKFRKDKASFDGTREWRGKPEALSGTNLLSQLESNGILEAQ